VRQSPMPVPAQTALDYVGLLEQPAFRDMVLCETVLEAVRPRIVT